MGGGSLSLACFGKLPFWREYLEAGTPSATSRALKEWLHRGKEELALVRAGDEEQGGARDTAIDVRLRLMLAPPASREILVGVLRPSRDAGGRHFPFATFVHLPRKIYGRHFALLPTGLEPVWEALDDAWDALSEVETPTTFEERIDAIEIPQPAPVSDVRGVYQGRQQDDARKLLEGHRDTSLDALAENMARIVEGLKNSASDGFLLQLPVARDVEEACFNASFWIDLFNRQFRLRRYEPSVLLDEQPGAAGRRVFLSFGPLRAEDYPGIMARELESGPFRPVHGEPTVGEVEAGAAAAAAEMSYGELLARKF